MTFYEELGVGPTANVLEIRQAYRLLARLVHPDRQQDPNCKQLAEDQMKRLNEILATLSNPEKRKDYDIKLKAAKALQAIQFELCPPEPIGRQIWQLTAQYGAWGVTAVLAVLCLVLLTLSPSTTPDTASGGKPSAPRISPANPEKRENAPSRAEADDPPQPNLESTESIGSIGSKSLSTPANYSRGQGRSTLSIQPQTKSSMPMASQSESVQPVPVDPAAQASQPTRSPAPPPAKIAQATFAGNWFFAPHVNENNDSGLYPPEYIELLLSETNGVLLGHFRARYHVPDRAVFPEVAFQIEGRGGQETSVHVGWKSANGAKGEANLKLLTSNTLEMNWWATTLSKQQGLVSGTAVLIKRLER